MPESRLCRRSRRFPARGARAPPQKCVQRPAHISAPPHATVGQTCAGVVYPEMCASSNSHDRFRRRSQGCRGVDDAAGPCQPRANGQKPSVGSGQNELPEAWNQPTSRSAHRPTACWSNPPIPGRTPNNHYAWSRPQEDSLGSRAYRRILERSAIPGRITLRDSSVPSGVLAAARGCCTRCHVPALSDAGAAGRHRAG